MKGEHRYKIQANKFLILIFVLLSIFVKFYQIGYRSFSLDELYGVVAGLEPNFNIFLENWVLYDSNPPLYYFFLRFWLSIVPATEFWVRLPSVIFVLLASFFFVNGIKKRFENTEWFYLLVFMGSSFSFLFFAQEARAYGLLFLFTCLQLLSFIDLLSIQQPKDFFKKLFLFVAYSILSSYTHYTGIVFSVILFFILIFIYHKKNVILKQILLSILVCFIAGLPWLKYFLFILKLDKSFIINQDVSIIKAIISMLFFGNTLIGKYFSVLFLIYIFFLSIYLVKNLKEIKQKHRIVLLIGFFSLTIVLISPIIKFFFQYRHYMVLMPIILLSISILFSFYDLKKNINNLFLSIGVIIVFSQGFTHYKSKREEWKQSVKYIVDSNKNKNTKVIVLGEPWEKTHKDYLRINPGYLNLSIRRKSFYSYYFDRFDKQHKLEIVVLRPNKNEIESFINEELKIKNQIFILSHAGEFKNKIKKLQLKGDVMTLEKDFYIHEVYHCVKNPN